MENRKLIRSIAMQEIEISKRSVILPTIVALWEASVTASHDFLSENDIAMLKPSVERAANSVTTLVVGSTDRTVGFMGIEERKIEMLFLQPEFFRRGIGTAFVRYGFERHGVNSVDCNEQNPGALAFYRRLGFAVEGRSAKDGAGRPFPLLHLRLASVPWHPDADGFEK